MREIEDREWGVKESESERRESDLKGGNPERERGKLDSV